MRSRLTLVFTLTYVSILGVGAVRADEPAGKAAPGSDFDRTIAPLLSSRCLDCHGGQKPKGGLDLARRKSVLEGGEGGPSVVPGNVEESLLWQRVADDEMPPKAPLTAAEKATLRDWIAAGAPWGTDPIDPLRLTTGRRAGLDWWAFRPVVRPEPPEVRGCDWPRNPLDRFVLARLETQGLVPRPEADRRTLIRRLSFDLIGLPPTPEEVEDFVDDRSPHAYERLVERLLASPHYGERWARHWLDVARFGESDGFERNTTRDNAWHYRNWLIWAINADMPYDEFVRLQVAGDVLRPSDPEAVKATGFLVAGVHNTVLGNDMMRAIARQDELEDIVGAVGQTFLGLTIQCARCHDHKFDPIPQLEYYRLASALGGVQHGVRDLDDSPVQAEIGRLTVEIRQVEGQMEAIAWPAGPGRDDLRRRLDEMSATRADLRARPKVKVYATVSRQPPPTHLLTRGQLSEPAEIVEPGGVAALAGTGHDFGLPPDAPESERRRRLAEWLTHPANPLTPRVMMNRLWHHHFGTGLVETPNDFGFNGGRPSHPEMLDWLAAEFVDRGHHLKAIHRLIVSSATYREGSAPDARGMALDADDRLLWRRKPLRLEAEAVRDTILAVAGRLNREVGGRGFSDYREAFLNGTSYFEPYDPTGPEAHRRSVYRFTPRGANQGLLDAFDCPDPASAAPRRSRTTTPIQALTLLNNGFVLRMAGAFADRLASEVPGDGPEVVDRRITRAWKLAFQREPIARERELAGRLVASHGYMALGRALFNANEFLSVE